MSKTMAATLYMYKIEHRMQICLRILRIACNNDHVLQYRWEKLKFKLAKGGKIKKSFNHPRSLHSTRPIQSNHFQADLIWCDSTFNIRAMQAGIRRVKSHISGQIF
jgi:hypothetical protein